MSNRRTPFADAHAHVAEQGFSDRYPDAADAAIFFGCTARPDEWERMRACDVGGTVRFYGVHPWYADQWDESTASRLRGMLEEDGNAHVGEIGLDYYWDEPEREKQQYWFRRQLALARETGLPVVIHSRDAAEDTMEIMKEHAKGLGGIIHCFSYSREMAKEYVKMGFSIGVGGVVTFKNGRKLKEIVKEIPLEKLVLETDCPYLAPEPNRGRRNDSRNIHFVAQQIAEIKGIDKETVIKQTENNAKLIYFS